MSAEDHIRADRDGWKLRCELVEKELADMKKRAEDAEAVVTTCQHIGISVEPRPQYEGYALRNVRAQQAEAEVDALKEQLEAVKQQRNAAIKTLDEVSVLTNRRGGALENKESVVASVQRIVDELAKLREGA